MRIIFHLVTAALLALAVVTIAVVDDARWEAPTLLFWFVVVAAALCVVSSLWLARLAHRLDQLELAIVAAFFLAGSLLPLVHGLTVPGVLYGDNAVTSTSLCLAIPVGALAALFVAHGPGVWRRRFAVCGVGVATLSVALLANPQTSFYPQPGSAAGVVYALATFATTVWFGWRHVRLAVIAERPQPLAVAMGYLLLGASALVFLGASTWSPYFWIAHGLDVIGVFLATIGGLVVYWRHGSISNVLGPITAIAPRQAFEVGLSPVVHRFVADLEAKDPITRDHVVRTGALAVDVAMELGLGPEEIRTCGLVGLLHDVGKLEIPDEILQKPGRLTDEEFEVMRGHAEAGGRLVRTSPVVAHLAPAIQGHHERIDGGGYPEGLEGDAIPLAARVVSACDSYDAMAFTRHYRQGMDGAKVRSILTEHAGAQWDQTVVDALLAVIEHRGDDAVWALDATGRMSSTDLADEDNPVCGCLPESVEV
ncbi:MAG: HD-GYP domain-containing protein [Actinomycetota bacterium]